MRSVAVVLFLAAFTATSLAQEPPNLLVNGNFEKVKPEGLLEAWNGWKREPEIEFKVSDEAHTGKHSGYVLTRGKAYHGGYGQSIKLKAGCRYRYSAWFKFKNHGTGSARCCYQETYREVNGEKKYPNSIAGVINKDCDWTYMENVFDTLSDKDSNYAMHVVLVYDDAEVWVDDARLIDCGPVLAVDNGKMTLDFGGGLNIVGIRIGKEQIGALRCDMAQFEKEGIGYKKTGVGWPRPVRAKAFEIKERSDARCVVDVTCEWTDSKETERKFEAAYRVTVLAGQPWFESRLLSIRNTDALDYEVRGYYHSLQPAEPEKAGPRCFATCAGWMTGGRTIGAAIKSEGDFVLGLRKAGNEACGDITRELKAKVKAGETWQSNDPSVFIFMTDDATDQGILEMQRRIMEPPPPSGKLTYKEAKGEGK